MELVVAELHHLIDSEQTAKNSIDLQPEFTRVICEAYQVSSLTEVEGRISVSVFAPLYLSDSAIYLSFGENKLSRCSAASSIKIAILLYYMHLFHDGMIKPTDLIQTQTINSLLIKMIRYSDNDSANILLNYVGLDTINKWYYSIGLRTSEFGFGRLFSSNPKPSDILDNTASNTALIILYFLIAQENDITGLLSSNELLELRRIINSDGEINSTREFNDRLNGAFPKGVPFYHKTGSNQENIVDAGIVYAGDIRFIIVAYDTGKDKEAMQRLGLGILKMMKRKLHSPS